MLDSPSCVPLHRGVEKYVNMAKDYAEESYEDFNKKLKKVLHEVGLYELNAVYP
jgi:hypothetical protein